MAANNRRRRLVQGLAGLAAGCAVRARAQTPEPGPDYRVIPQQPVPPGGVIEVLEFFWYGCPFCYRLQDPLEAWLPRQRNDVLLRRIPAIFRPSWIAHARLYFALEALDLVPRLHRAVFDAIHTGGNRLEDGEAIAEWMVRQGIARERWASAYDDPQMEGLLRGALAQLQQYRVSGTPTLVVAGRYLTSSSMTAGVPALVPVLDRLVALARETPGPR